MASKGSKSTILAPHLTLKWSWEVKSRDIANKLTTVSWKAEVVADDSGSITSYTSVPWTFTAFHIASNTTLEEDSGSGSLRVNANETKQIASGTFEVASSCSIRFDLDHGTLANVLGQLPYNQYIEGGFSLDAYPQGVVILTAPKFTDEENPVLKYSLDTDEATDITAKLKVGTYTVTRAIADPTGEYTFVLTNDERDGIRNQVKNSITEDATFTISIKLYNQTLSDSLDGQVQIVNAAPVLAPTYTSATPNILAEQNSISVAANATAQKGATIKSYLITCGTKQIKAASGTFTDISSNIINFTAIDSRGYQSTATLTLDMIPYVKPTCNIESTNPVDNDNGTLTVTFNISGAFYEGNFNDGTTNALTLKYRATIDNTTGDWITFGSTDVDIDRNSYETSVSFILQPTQQISIEVQAQDNINTITATMVSKELMPVFDWSSTDFNFNVPVYINKKEVPTIVGSGTFTTIPNGTFTWRKWSDGTSECWGRVSFSCSFQDGNWGGLSTTGAIAESEVSLPAGLFISTPHIVAQLLARSKGGILMPHDGSGVSASATTTGSYEIVRGNYISSSNAFTICYNIKGNWK